MSCVPSVLRTREGVPGRGEGKSEGADRQRGSILGGLGIHPGAGAGLWVSDGGCILFPDKREVLSQGMMPFDIQL